MAEHNLVAQIIKGIEDPDAFKEVCAVFGDAGALARLETFRADLGTHLRGIECEQRDLEALREFVHQTAGRAGFLGFPALAEASARLEEAICANARVTLALEDWSKQARLAVAGGAQTNEGGTPQGR